MNADESITELAAAVAALGALPVPVPVGPEPQEPAEVFVPQTERSYWVAIADALNAAHSAGMPVGIDLDGTLTDHNAWSVVWNREADRWSVAGYEDGFPAPDAESRKTFAERAARETDPGRRAAWRMLAEPEPEFHAYLHHPYQREHDLPETGGAPVSTGLVEPNGCSRCGVPEREHFQRWKKPASGPGWHKWIAPSQVQIKARMLARRAARKQGAS